jgi:hypothetical protein
VIKYIIIKYIIKGFFGTLGAWGKGENSVYSGESSKGRARLYGNLGNQEC